MAASDPIADMLAKVQNAAKAGHEKVDVPTSKMKLEIVKILKTEGYITVSYTHLRAHET